MEQYVIVLGRGIYVTFKNALILAKGYGQYRSGANRECLDEGGSEIPWYTYPALEYLENHDITELNVVEYGSGNSSLYYLSRTAHLTSLEDDLNWFTKVRARTGGGHNYVFANTRADYVERPEVDDADIIVVDGSYRSSCAKFLISKILSKESLPCWIIFDNSERYPVSIAKLDGQLGWPRIDFCGFGPINAYTWVTSIYINPGRLIPRRRHIASIRGINRYAEGEGEV